MFRHLAQFQPLPWMCVGYFNETLNFLEKQGIATRPSWQIEYFKNVMEDCQLSDLGFRASKFTWNNGRTDNGFTKERFDRVVPNKEWCELYGAVDVWVLANRGLIHNTLLISFSHMNDSKWKKC